MQITITIAAVVGALWGDRLGALWGDRLGALWGDRLGALWGITTKTAIGHLQNKVTAKMQFQQAYSSLIIRND